MAIRFHRKNYALNKFRRKVELKRFLTKHNILSKELIEIGSILNENYKNLKPKNV